MHRSKSGPLMSTLGQERTSPVILPMSALPPKADKEQPSRYVRFVPKADIRTAANDGLLDHLVGEGEQLIWNGEAECLGRLEIDYQLELGWLHDRQV